MSHHEDRLALEESLPNIIDDAWHYSWHWERTESRSLTLAGWARALGDARKVLRRKELEVARLRNTIPLLVNVVAEETEMEKDREES